jgi:hypothetical protein
MFDTSIIFSSYHTFKRTNKKTSVSPPILLTGLLAKRKPKIIRTALFAILDFYELAEREALPL